MKPPSVSRPLLPAYFGTEYDGSCCYGGVSAEDRGGCRYNEVVLDGFKYSSRLPQIIEAIFYPTNGCNP